MDSVVYSQQASEYTVNLPLAPARRYLRLGGQSPVELAHDEAHVHIGEAGHTELVHSLHLGADI